MYPITGIFRSNSLEVSLEFTALRHEVVLEFLLVEQFLGDTQSSLEHQQELCRGLSASNHGTV